MQARMKTPSARRSQGGGSDLYDLDQQQAKAALGRQIVETIQVTGLAQLSAAKTLGIDQPKVSRLMRMQLDEFSTARLLRFLALLGRDVEIVVRGPLSSPRREMGRLRVIGSERVR